MPFVGPISTVLGEIYQYTLHVDSGYKYNTVELRTVQDWIFKRQMMMVKGVIEVNSFDQLPRVYKVDPYGRLPTVLVLNAKVN